MGKLRPVFLRPLCDLLAAHTTTPDRSWFAIWEGGGWLDGPGASLSATRDGCPPPRIEHATERWQLDLRAPRFGLPYSREYLLFWPDDHAWCVATEIDFDNTLVGGSRPLIDAIAGSPALKAFAISAGAPPRATRSTFSCTKRAWVREPGAARTTAWRARFAQRPAPGRPHDRSRRQAAHRAAARRRSSRAEARSRAGR